MKLTCCLMILLCLLLSKQIFAGHSNPIGVGDKIPSLKIKNVINSSSTIIDFKQFKGKTVIVHFLLTTCPACVASSRKYANLIKEAGDNFKVLIVTQEPKEKVDKFLAKHPFFFGDLPIVVNDTILKNLFPYEYVSHLVWINPEGKVAAITGTEYVSLKNVKEVSKGILPDWPIKRDLVGFDTKKNLVKINDNNIPYLSMPVAFCYSVLSSNMADLPVYINHTVDTAQQIQKTTFINQTIPDLYRRVYELPLLPPTQILIDAPEPDYYYWDKSKSYLAGWEAQNTYCYEASMPENYSLTKARIKMIEDLDFNLGIHSFIKDTIMNCRVLTKNNSTFSALKDSVVHYEEWMAIRNIVTHLNEVYGALPVINEAPELSEKYAEVNMELLHNETELQIKLREFGLQIIIKPVQIKLLVLRQEQNFRFTHSPKLYEK